MNILMINKFLHPNGGSETYIFKLGTYLRSLGHAVEFFGMDHPDRIVGNRVDSYTSNMDFHGGSTLEKLTYPLKTIYSSEARRKLRRVLEDFQPDVCHLNNFNYQLTPSVILEIRAWEKSCGHRCKIIYTAHDGQLVCPNHMMKNPGTGQVCEKCLGGNFLNCTRGRCIHGSLAKSLVGTMEAIFWKLQGVYKQLDLIICCSHFMKSKLDTNPVFASKTVAIHNFVDRIPWKHTAKKDYVLYFGRYSQEKGVATLIRAAKELPHIPFVFAGSGPLEEQLQGIDNIQNVGFVSGEILENLIRQARFTVIPSEWYENCPFSVMESLMYGTPVLGADIGGIPELIRPGVDGELFESGNKDDLKRMIEALWNKEDTIHRYVLGCREASMMDVEAYCRTVEQALYADQR